MRSTRTLWRWLGVIFLLSFAALGFLGWQIHLQAPPIPKAVVSQDGQVLFGEGEVTRGQQAWLATGGQQLGTVWGHGSYVAPDWSADWLHREAVALRDLWAAQRHGKPYEQLDVEQRGAIEALAPQYPHVHWRLVGNDRLPHPEQPDTTYRDDFLARHRGQPWLQRVQFQGEVDDAALLAAYRACDLLVAPSRYESFGLIYVEAMRAGKPCIGGADGGGGEIITPDIGLAVPTDDPAPLMEALRRLITDAALRQRMGQRARQHYLQQYAEHAFAKRMLALLT
ncbi:glycosyltransferase family 4 protein [Hydrogenophilus hirschii]